MKEYDTEPIEWIKHLPIKEFSAKNSMILMWITDPNVDHIKEVLNAWGFKYKGKFHTWIKLNKGYQKMFKKLMLEMFESKDLREQLLEANTPHKFYRILGQNMPDEGNILEIMIRLTKMGMGFITRKNSESLYYATRGKGLGIPKNIKRNIRELIYAPIGKHSTKPTTVYDNIERMYPSARKIEFFARTKRDGWDRAICNDLDPTVELLDIYI